MTRRILLVGHPRRPEAIDVAATLVRGLAAHDIAVMAGADEIAAFGIADEPTVHQIDDGEPLTDIEVVVILGGDGTILRGAEMVRGTSVPLLGINLGHVGFLAEAEPEDIQAIVEGIAARSWHVESRATLDVVVTLDGDEVHRGWALNEAAVEKAARERMLEIVVEVDGRPLSTWGCDGVVMATPTGSTAYAFSGGGPVLWPDVGAILLVPLAAHALFARPLVFGQDTQVAIEVTRQTQGNGVLWFDGRRSIDLPPGARIEVRASAERTHLARLTDAPFTDRLVAKFNLPVAGWRGQRAP